MRNIQQAQFSVQSATLDGSGTSTLGLEGLSDLSLFPVKNAPPPCLYDRLGGEPKVNEMTRKFFEHIGKEQALMEQFFVNVPVPAIQLHQGKFFKVLFGPEEERCSPDELLDYMVATHVRLFRDLGLNETHFDIVATCFIKALQDVGFTQDEVDECVAIVGPLRLAFQYGAQVAKQEKHMSVKKMSFDELPTATMDTMRAKQAAKLPPQVPPPDESLVKILGGDREQVRAWTCALTQRFVVQDEVLSETFAAIPYLEMEPYLHIFLLYAFGGRSSELGARIVLRKLRFPLGLAQAKYQLTRVFFRRMVEHFEEVGQTLMRDQAEELTEAVKRLKLYSDSLQDTDPSGKKRRVGSKKAHTLKRDSSDEVTTVTSDSSSRGSGAGGVSLNSNGKSRQMRLTKNPIFAWLLGRRRVSK